VTAKPLIYGQLAKAMGAVGAVSKGRKNQQQGYAFRGIDDVMAHVQPVLAEFGVVCVARVIERERETGVTKSGGSMHSVRLLVEHTFYAEDGSSVVCTTLGEAMDSGDKASNKAMSAALKYALTETLMIPTYEAERDTEDSSPEMVAPQMQEKVTPPAKQAARSRKAPEPAHPAVDLAKKVFPASKEVEAREAVLRQVAAIVDDLRVHWPSNEPADVEKRKQWVWKAIFPAVNSKAQADWNPGKELLNLSKESRDLIASKAHDFARQPQGEREPGSDDDDVPGFEGPAE
jgi:hypothetical protein